MKGESVWKGMNRIRESMTKAYSKAVQRSIYSMLNNTFTNLERADTLQAMGHIIEATAQPKDRIMALYRDMYLRAGIATGSLQLDNIVKARTPVEVTKENPFIDTEPLRNATVDVSFFRQAMITFAEQVGADHVTKITDTNRRILKDIITAANENGWSVDKTVRHMRAYFSGDLSAARATMIARTEIMSASSYANNLTGQLVEQQFGIKLMKFWIPTPTRKYRPTHLAMAGKPPIPFTSYYVVGGNQWLHPHAPDMGPEDLINCRCTEGYIPV